MLLGLEDRGQVPFYQMPGLLHSTTMAEVVADIKEGKSSSNQMHTDKNKRDQIYQEEIASQRLPRLLHSTTMAEVVGDIENEKVDELRKS